LSVPVQVIAWKDSSLKWPNVCRAGLKTTHSLTCCSRYITSDVVIYYADISTLVDQELIYNYHYSSCTSCGNDSLTSVLLLLERIITIPVVACFIYFTFIKYYDGGDW